MDNNPFVSRINDLIIMLIAGMSIHFVSRYLFPISVQTQFLIVLSFAFLSGLFMSYLYQSIEWALFFWLGIQSITLIPFLVLYLKTQSLPTHALFQAGLHSVQYSIFLLSSWLVGLPVGYMLQRLLMGNYYRQSFFK